MKQNKVFNTIICFFIFIVLFVNAVYARGENTQPIKKIRIGYFEFENQLIGAGEGKHKSGFIYDYLQEIAAINNWEFEYVYGPFTDLFVKLKNGEIDLIGPLVYTEERASQLLFTEKPITNEIYYIATVREKAVEYRGLPSNLNGRVLGTVKDTHQNVILNQWLEQNNVQMKIVEYNDYPDVWVALGNGEVEYVLEIDNTAPLNYVPIENIGYKDSYMVFAQGREVLVKEYNNACKMLKEINPYCYENLGRKYFSNTLSSHLLKKSELSWLEKHNIIYVGGLANDFPYHYSGPNKQNSGLAVDVIERIFKRLNINQKIEWKFYPTIRDLHVALRNKEIDIVSPDYHNYNYAEQMNIRITEAYEKSFMGILYKGKFNAETMKNIVTPITRLGDMFISDNYKDMAYSTEDSLEDCVKLLSEGKATGVIANLVALEQISDSFFEKYYLKTLPDTCNVCFSCRKEDGPLVMLLNRGLHMIPEREIKELAYNYKLESEKSFKLKSFILENFNLILIMLFVIILAFTIYIQQVFIKNKQFRNSNNLIEELNVIKDEKNELQKKISEEENAKNVRKSFFFNISHDIRNTMNSSVGFINLARKNIDDKVVVLDYLNKASGSNSMLLSLVNDIVDMCQMDTKHLVIEEKIVDIENFKQEFLNIVEPLCGIKNISFTYDDSSVEHHWLYADELRLSRLLYNIVKNAISNTDENGDIKLIISEIPSSKAGCGKYTFRISDNGAGLSQEILEKLNAETDDEVITDIKDKKMESFYVAKSLISLMNGSFIINSKLGHGTSIEVSFDFQTVTDGQDELKDDNYDVSILNGKKVLLVEDNDLNMDIATDILEEFGLEVDKAENGSVALEKVKSCLESENVKEAIYDFILMDLQMPVMDGYKATEEIRKLEKNVGTNVPIIAMTAAVAEEKQKTLSSGFNAHLSKPINVEELAKTLMDYV